jgi:hypothetical protein
MRRLTEGSDVVGERKQIGSMTVRQTNLVVSTLTNAQTGWNDISGFAGRACASQKSR